MRPTGAQRIVFSAQKYPNVRQHFRGAVRLHVVRPSGRGLRPVRGAVGADPVWSPEGRALVFTIFERGVFVKTLGRRGLRIVADSQSGDSGSHTAFHPAWRPLPRRR